MATRFIEKTIASVDEALNYPNAAGILMHEGMLFAHDGTSVLPVGTSTPVTVTAAVTLSKEDHASRTVLIDNAAGIAVTLPAATGSGVKFRLVIATALATGDVTVTTASGETLKGVAFVGDSGDSTPQTVDMFVAGASDEIFTFDQSVGGGSVGDFIELEDIAADTWLVRAVIAAQADPETPFSSAA